VVIFRNVFFAVRYQANNIHCWFLLKIIRNLFFIPGFVSFWDLILQAPRIPVRTLALRA